MSELIFKIEDIFEKDNQTGCLCQYDCNFFHIPAYQRGYKWASTQNGAVSILLNDMWNEFIKTQKKDRKEYFLQYITVKKIELEKGFCLEVIDGQQRLTTLSILLSVLSLKLSKINITKNKLDYAVRENFFNDVIYESDKLTQLLTKDWGNLINEYPDYNKQDIYYMFEAALKCNVFLKDTDQIEEFYNYILNNVKLIVNSVEKHIESESVFKNLNSNKVPLTEAELIKGLLITKIGRANNETKPKHFTEIMEIRHNVGRIWDELNIWANTFSIKSFFFNNKTDAMHELLQLTALIIDESKAKLYLKSNSKDFPLFNFFLEQNDYLLTFNKLEEVKNTLDNWFHSTEIYNLLGYCRFAKNSGSNNLLFLRNNYLKNDKIELIANLKLTKSELLKNIDFQSINYQDTPDKIHHILLAINVFIEGQENTRFNFHEFEKENWTLEHIFPQTPEGKNNVLKPDDKEAIIKILENPSDEVKRVLNLEVRSEIEKQIYYNALREHPALNSISNMCLLTGGDNASNGNKFFNEKRDNILKLIQKGSFVPKHTFDLFSKMFSNANTDNMKIWSIEDIDAHLAYIKQSINYKEEIIEVKTNIIIDENR